jgi:hypothetical protein
MKLRYKRRALSAIRKREAPGQTPRPRGRRDARSDVLTHINTRHIRVLDGKKVFLKDQVLEAPNVEGRLHVSRKERRPDEWDPPVEPYDRSIRPKAVVDAELHRLDSLLDVDPWDHFGNSSAPHFAQAQQPNSCKQCGDQRRACMSGYSGKTCQTHFIINGRA